MVVSVFFLLFQVSKKKNLTFFETKESMTQFHLFLRNAEDEQAVGASYCETMDDLLRQSDFVVLAVNLTPETTNLISHRELSLMKPTATLVNISRGEDPLS